MTYASNFTVKKLAASGAEMNPTDIRGRTPLHYLCRSSHPDSEMMKQMLELGARIDVQDVDGVAPLYLAALHDLESHARLLLEAGANFNLADKTGYSPLLWAALGGATGVAQELLERMGQEGLAEKLESIRDNHGRTVLHVASMADQASFIEWLTSLCGISTLMQAKDNLDNTAIHLAAQVRKENAVKQLLRLRSETRVQNQSKQTPVHLAAENKFTEIVRILFDTDDADGLLEDCGGQTPLHLAVLTGHKETVELLLSLESDALRIYDIRDMRPLHYAASEGFNDIIDLLFEDQDTKTYDNEVTLLHLAAKYGHIDTVKLLVAKGVPANWIDYHDQTPLDLAIEEGHEEIVQFLLSQPDVRLEDKRGNTLLHSAAMKGHIEISRLIFDIKKEEIDVNSANVDGQTPLHLAAEKGHSDMIDFLIEVCKCDKTRRNNDGYGPLEIAESTGNHNVLTFWLTSLVSKGMWVMRGARRMRRMHLKRYLNCQERA
ncbi:hypothetical protein LCI18_003212 [Fusarium solani-melongenae]|uniref:Uncharacterized protein n=1 Tax=Fusarium solani subsp. cucurbitae TaxID=2747967 RepID=A0ACD3YTH3_FUSSC|nr:hypothetical protein LCI18_003212 [Fusarium solani-melongenae]